MKKIKCIKSHNHSTAPTDENNIENVYLLAGSNLGDRLKNLENAQTLISEKLGEILSSSRIYETEPWGYDSENTFYNQALQIKTFLSATELLQKINEIEISTGRTRNHPRYSDRILDIDILLFGNRIINTSDLTLPHPLLHMRRFALAPLQEIAPDVIHPLFNKNITQLLTECNDKLEVKICKREIS